MNVSFTMIRIIIFLLDQRFPQSGRHGLLAGEAAKFFNQMLIFIP